MSRKKQIHINQHAIKRNRKQDKHEPVITCKTYNSNDYGDIVIIRDGEGNEVARVVYNWCKPLSCGAVCWVETKYECELVKVNEDCEPVGRTLKVA